MKDVPDFERDAWPIDGESGGVETPIPKQEPDGGEVPEKKDTVRKRILAALAAILLIILVLVLLHSLGYFLWPWETPAPVAVASGDMFPGAGSAQEVMDAMQSEVDLKKFSFEINAEPLFENGSSEGDLYIINPSGNGYPMVVQIVLNSTGEIIYDSGGIMPGYEIVNDKLITVLSKGKYDATARIYAYDPDTEEAIGEVTASLTITIQN